MNWLNKLERKYSKYAVHNLMYYIIIIYAIGFVLEVFGNGFYSRYLSLNIGLVLQGQFWRLFTFIMGPPSTSLFFIFFSLYFYYILGNVLENAWGAFRFNLYLLSGWALHVIAAVLIYVVFHMNFSFDTYYLNMSLFLAFATLAGDMELLLFFLIPIKIKWLAYLDMLYFGLTIFAGFCYSILPRNMLMGFLIIGITPSPVYATAALLSLMNFLVFYGMTRNYRRISPSEMRRKAEYQTKVKTSTKSVKHRCAVCGKTEKDGDDLVFRYCSKCEGAYEYCNEHLYTHKHVVEALKDWAKDE